MRGSLRLLLLALCFWGFTSAAAEANYPSYAAFRSGLVELARIADDGERAAAVDAFWQRLVAQGQIPYTQGNRVAWLHRGGDSVAFAGDFNRWNPSSGAARRLPGTDLWFFESTLPEDARVDYKVVRNEQWLLDPYNPHQQWSGFGPNSELRMPAYEFPTETVPDPTTPRGNVLANRELLSQQLAAPVRYRVYTPAGYEPGDALPVVYFTDGHEYLDDRLGAAAVVLDNLIHAGMVRPTIAVFIDPRDPRDGQNRRMAQLGGAERDAFADFLALELVPHIDQQYGTAPTADQRVLMGTSLGGLFAAHFGARHPDVIANLAIQSPAFWYDPSIYETYAQHPSLADALRIYMHSGRINDNGGAEAMAGLLAQDGYDFEFHLVSDGHSWGHWKGQIDAALIELIGPVPEPAAMGAALIGGCAITRRCPCRRRASRNRGL